MDADTILEIKPALTEYLHQFDDCFGRSQTRDHMSTYVHGQLGNLPRKSVEPIADAAGTPPRTLQEFLSLSRWDESRMRDRMQQRVARRHAHEQGVGIVDETSFPKKGDKTACVQRQHCGATGKRDNCVVSVHLGYATPAPGNSLAPDSREGFHTLLDGELYLPEKTWDGDVDRRREAGIADQVTYRAKWRIALDQYHRAVGNGVRFRWLTFDEGYGGKPPFLRALDAMGQDFVAEVPRDFHVWTQLPQVLHRRHARDQHDPRGGRPRKYPRLKVQHNPAVPVENVLRYSPAMRKQPWVKYQVKDASKGPMVWEAKHLLVYLKDEHGLPAAEGKPFHLLVARNVLNPEQVKYFISNASESTPVQALLWVAFSRWRIERMFEDSKMELGMDHFEVRKFVSISRHLILSCVSHLFLAEFVLAHGEAGVGVAWGKKGAADDQPDRHGGKQTGRALGLRRPLLSPSCRTDRRAIDDNATAQCQSRSKPSQANDPPFTPDRHSPERSTDLLLAQRVAL